MASSDNFENTLEMTAPAGGVTVGTMVFDATLRVLVLPLTTATSGNTYCAKVAGKVLSVPVVSTAAYSQGQALAWSTTSTALGAITTGTTANSQAVAAAAIASGATTGDVILRFPQAFVAP